MWDEYGSDISDSEDSLDSERFDYSDTSGEFDEASDSSMIESAENGDATVDTDLPFQEDEIDNAAETSDAGLIPASDETSETSGIITDSDAPFVEDGADDTLPAPDSTGVSASSAELGEVSEESGDMTSFDEDTAAAADSQHVSNDADESDSLFDEDDVDEGDDSTTEGPVLRRDPAEIAAIQENTWLQRAEILRDDLRDKGWEDGPQMEEFVASQMDQWRTEAAQTNQTYFGTPDTTQADETLEEDVFSDTVSESGDSGEVFEDTSSDASHPSDVDETEPFDEDVIQDSGTIDSEEETSDQADADSTPQPIDDTTDVTRPFAEDQIEKDESPFPSGFDYSKVDWDKVYSEINAEQSVDITQHNYSEVDATPGVSTTGLSPDFVDDDVGADIGNDQEPFWDQLAPVSTADATSSDMLETASDSDASDIQSVSDVSNWIGEINPNFDEFDPESPYCNNCGSCAFAVYQRLEGSTDSCASADNIGYNSEMEALTGMDQVSMNPEEIEQRLLAEGDGAHAIIGIDRAEGPGHWFNAACIDGRVVAIDGQSGEICDWPPDYGDVVNWEMSVKRV